MIGIALNRAVLLAGDQRRGLGGGRHRRAHAPGSILAWVLSIAATLGIITGAVFLMPAVTAFVGSFFVDEIADEVERTHYPADPPGRALPLWRALIEGIKTALLSIAVYLCAVPFLLFAGFGLVIMFVATAYLLGREYFLLAGHALSPARRGQGAAPRRSAAACSSPAC